LGLSLSFEFWGSVYSLNQRNSRWFDFGNGASNDSVVLSMDSNSNGLYTTIYQYATGDHTTLTSALSATPNSFQQIVFTINQVSLSDTTSVTASEMKLYTNGVLKASRLGYLPTLTPRQQLVR
jgi:hypothetical protein